MKLNESSSSPSSETFGQDASFRLEQPIGAMSISPSGRDAVLASKEGLHIIDLDSPYSPPRYLPHRTPWEVADVQWSPFAVRDYWIVSTSNQKALVWNVGVSGWRDAIEHVLHGHTRAITDINFSAYHPDVLATCAVDSFVHGWDLRAPSRPVFSFSDWFAGATQVKWSRQDEHVIASSHDKFLHIWDKRKGASPARSIEAHGTKIYGIDWNRFEPTKIVTCSLDRTIKFWNTDDPEDVPERVIETPFPVWRARHTPFGWGLLAMPQRGSSDLHLYDRRPVDGVLQSGQIDPVTTFSGHNGQVKEFLWRARGTIMDGVDHRDFQLVSWGTDSELRLHNIQEDTFNAIGYEKGVSRPLRINFTRKNARYRTFRDDVGEPYSPLELPARTDSNQSHQPFSSRARPSTNIGMSKIAVAQFRGWLHGGKRERRTGMHGKSTVRQDMNPITWMKNVKISSWDPDSLADEVTHVGQKFKKVEFESVDINQRKAVVSLQGPWGENGAMLYTRADFRFPKNYPRDAAAIVTLHKSNAIDDEVFKTLSTEVHTIAQTYASRQRGCIEAVVRYLLHEQTLEQVVAWLLGEMGDDLKTLSVAEINDEMSSDSDDDNLDINPDPSSSSANIRVPLAKACGAQWSNNGSLICFFPQQSKEPESVLSRFSMHGAGESQANKLFEAFGRLQTSSPARRPTAGTQATTDDASSEISDVTSTFSSSSSSSSESESEAVMRDGFAHYSNAINLGLRQRSRSPDRSNKSTTMDGTKIGQENRLNTVVLHHETQDMLPSRKTLAEQYKTHGPGVEVCEHNAMVADKLHLTEIASVWRILALILEQNVLLETFAIDGLAQDFAVVMRQNLSRLQRKDSGIDLRSGKQSHFDEVSYGHIKWGNSPLGSKYIIAAIFNHFQRQADIQMLATLSSVLLQSQAHNLGFANIKNSKRTFKGSDSYQPSPEVAFSLSNSQIQNRNRLALGGTRPIMFNKASNHLTVPASREFQNRRKVTSSPSFPESMRDDEIGNRDISIKIDNPRGDAMSTRQNTMSVAHSPEESRFNRRVNSGVAFAASRASLSALAQSFQQSPPSNSSTAGSSLKKFSPSTTSNWAGNLFGSAHNNRSSRASQAPSEANSDEASNPNLRGSLSFANLQDLHRQSHRVRGGHGNFRSTVIAGKKENDGSGKTRKREVRTSLRNQNRFDLDGYPDVPILNPESQLKHVLYRSTYADQLGSWGLFHQQAELLKLNGSHGNLGSRQRRTAIRSRPPSLEVEITRCCLECGNTLVAIVKNGTTVGWNCADVRCRTVRNKVSMNQVCSICDRVVRGLSIPCLECGHMTCYECAQEWFVESGRLTATNQMEGDDHGSPDEENSKQLSRTFTCPTGCGCNCPSHNTITVPATPGRQDRRKEELKDASNLVANKPKNTRNLTSSSTATTIPASPTSTILRHSSNVTSGPPADQPNPQRTKSEATIPGPDTALGAMMALSRSRAPSTTTKASMNTTSTTTTTTAGATAAAEEEEEENSRGSTTSRQNQHEDDPTFDDLVPWATGKFTSLGRGIGGGLSRGLSNKSSDATIRRA